MDYDIQIIWGNQDDISKTKLREMMKECLKGLQLLPCWKESQFRPFLPFPWIKGNKAKVMVNGHIVYAFHKDAVAINVDVLQERILQFSQRKRKVFNAKVVQSTVTALFIAFFPKCPVCWATYMSVLGCIGVEKLPYFPWMIYVLGLTALVNIYYSYHRDKSNGVYFTTLLQTFIYTVIIINWKFMGSKTIALTCIFILVLASVFDNFKRQFVYLKLGRIIS